LAPTERLNALWIQRIVKTASVCLVISYIRLFDGLLLWFKVFEKRKAFIAML
jgi:hypothetical protein